MNRIDGLQANEIWTYTILKKRNRWELKELKSWAYWKVYGKDGTVCDSKDEYV